MRRASHFFSLLLLISIPTLIFLSSHLLDLQAQNDIEKPEIPQIFRVLLAMERRPSPSSLAPSPVPSPAPKPPFQAPRRHEHHQVHHPSHSDHRDIEKSKVKVRRFVTVVAASVGIIILAIIFGASLVIRCRRRRSRSVLEKGIERSTAQMNSTSKVSSDHGVELFFKNVEAMKIESDSVSLLAEDINSVHSLPSDDESFYSISNSLSSCPGVLPSIPDADFSRFNSISGSASPYTRVSRFTVPKTRCDSLDAESLTLSRKVNLSERSSEESTKPTSQTPLIGKASSGTMPPPPPPPPLPPPMPPTVRRGSNSSHPPPRPPLPKLKPLHWDKVRAAPDRSMVWDKIRFNSFEFDEEMIESLFGYNNQSSIKTEELKSKNSSSSKHILEAKRLQNFTILMKALNASTDQICSALIQGTGLSLQQLEVLVKLTPTKEEEEKLSSYAGDTSLVDSAELFLKTLLIIPHSFSRIKAMLYRESFDDDVDHLRKSFATLEEACKELRSSKLFLRLLETVLKTGNRMNVGTIRGGARAFKLDALLKLADVKGADGKTSLLHFVVQEIIHSEGDTFIKPDHHETKLKPPEDKEDLYGSMGLKLVSELSDELSHVRKTASIDLDVLASSVSNLSYGMNELRKLIEQDLTKTEESERFVSSMRTFIDYASKIMKELEDAEVQVLHNVREITAYYHGDLSRDDSHPLQIFDIVSNFLGMLDRVCKELGCSRNRRRSN